MWRLVGARALQWAIIGASTWFVVSGCAGTSEPRSEDENAGASAGVGANATGGSRAKGGSSGSSASGFGAGRGGSGHAGAANLAGKSGTGTSGMSAGGEGAITGGGATGESAAGAGQSGNAGAVGNAGQVGTAGESGAGGTGKLPPGVCPSPTTFSNGLVGCGTYTYFEHYVESSFVHRPEPLGCPAPPRLSEPLPELDGCTSCGCTQDMECGPGGYCLSLVDEGYETYYDCYYPCVSDSDCDSGEICACEPMSRTVDGGSGGLGVCVAATCASDQDCPANQFCSSAIKPTTCDSYGYWATQFSCQTSADECFGPEECHGVFEFGDQYDVCRPASDGTKLVCKVATDCG